MSLISCFTQLWFGKPIAFIHFMVLSIRSIRSPIYQVHIDRIERVQRWATRAALRSSPWASNIPSYDIRCLLLGIKPLSYRRNVASAMFIRDIISNHLDSPQLLAECNFHIPSRLTRSTSLLDPGFHRTNYGRNEPMALAIREFERVGGFDFGVSRSTYKSAIS